MPSRLSVPASPTSRRCRLAKQADWVRPTDRGDATAPVCGLAQATNVKIGTTLPRRARRPGSTPGADDLADRTFLTHHRRTRYDYSMDDHLPEGPGDLPPDEPSTGTWARRQVYFVTVEWLDEPHQPESLERLAQILRHAIEHGHSVPPGTPASRFLVRVKAGDVASEVEGTLEHHHHHHG